MNENKHEKVKRPKRSEKKEKDLSDALRENLLRRKRNKK
jgi:hypothetical protein